MSHAPPPSLEPRGIDPESADVRIIAVFGVIFGTLGLSCLPFNFGNWLTYGWPVQSSGRSPIAPWVMISTIVGLAQAGVLLLSSLATYRLLWWGRDGMLIWAWTSLIHGIVGIFFWGRFLFPWLNSQYADMRGPDELAGLLAWIVGSIFSIAVLIYFSRPGIRSVFVRKDLQPQTGPSHG
ncbi:MAG TPA: hypothetical protein VN541_17965 [Tepidisphaeraceae bacterium]|nr:hypothetical protein [Tepidisphaeraceae bacterium]